MKLTELDPHWLVKDGEKVGIVFRSPTGKQDWLTCFWIQSPSHRETYELVWASGVIPKGSATIIACTKGITWKREGDTFDDLTLTPSLDASASGNWHGFITKGEIK